MVYYIIITICMSVFGGFSWNCQATINHILKQSYFVGVVTKTCLSEYLFTGMSIPTQKVFSRFLSVILKILAILGLFTKSNVFDKGIIEFPPKYRIKID